jgi:hypothetical protein
MPVPHLAPPVVIGLAGKLLTVAVHKVRVFDAHPVAVILDST